MSAQKFTVAVRHRDGTSALYHIQGTEFKTAERCRAYAAWKLRARVALCVVGGSQS